MRNQAAYPNPHAKAVYCQTRPAISAILQEHLVKYRRLPFKGLGPWEVKRLSRRARGGTEDQRSRKRAAPAKHLKGILLKVVFFAYRRDQLKVLPGRYLLVLYPVLCKKILIGGDALGSPMKKGRRPSPAVLYPEGLF